MIESGKTLDLGHLFNLIIYIHNCFGFLSEKFCISPCTNISTPFPHDEFSS